MSQLEVNQALSKAVEVLGKDPAATGVQGLIPQSGRVREEELAQVVTGLIDRFLDRQQPILNAILLLETVRLAEALNEQDTAGIPSDPDLPTLSQADVNGGTVDSVLTPETIHALPRIATALRASGLPQAAQRLIALGEDCGGPLGGVWRPRPISGQNPNPNPGFSPNP